MGCIVVTGAAGGLGSAVVRHLVAAGGKVAAVGAARDREALSALAGELGAALLPVTADAGAKDDWARALTEIEPKLGPVAGAVLTVGGWRGGKALAASDDDEWDAMQRVNVATIDRSLRALLPGMVARRAGSIVVIGSRAVERPWTSTGAATYAASKAAVVALAEVAAAEVREHGVRVNAVLPSTIDTKANRAAMPSVDPSIWVSPESLAGVIAFLLSDASRDVSGAAIPVYGRA